MKGAGYRTVQVGNSVRAVVSEYLATRSPLLPPLDKIVLSVSRTRVSKDLRHADVYITALQTPDATRVEIIDILNNSRHLFSRFLNDRLRLKNVPKLRFVWGDPYRELDDPEGQEFRSC